MIVLDTHVWIWINLAPELLPSQWAKVFSDGSDEIALSTISLVEVMLAIQKGRVSTPEGPERTVRRWVDANPIKLLPIDAEIAILSRTLEFEHQDPADRLIGATAYCHRAKLATTDQALVSIPFLSILEG